MCMTRCMRGGRAPEKSSRPAAARCSSARISYKSRRAASSSPSSSCKQREAVVSHTQPSKSVTNGGLAGLDGGAAAQQPQVCSSPRGRWRRPHRWACRAAALPAASATGRVRTTGMGGQHTRRTTCCITNYLTTGHQIASPSLLASAPGLACAAMDSFSLPCCAPPGMT